MFACSRRVTGFRNARAIGQHYGVSRYRFDRSRATIPSTQMLFRSISQRMWFLATVLLAITNVTHATFFDWSDRGIHAVVGVLCVVAGLLWQRGAAAIAALILLLVMCGELLSSPPEWTVVRSGDDWNRTQQRLGPPTYEASNLAQARLLITGYSVPSPLRFVIRVR
jgi:hypothetical protein